MAVATAESSSRTDSSIGQVREWFVLALLTLHNLIAGVQASAVRGARHLGLDLSVTPRAQVDPAAAAELPVMRAVKMVGGGVIGIAVTVLVVNEVLTVNAINNSTGPFTGVINSLDTTGVAAMTLLVVGLLVFAASVIMDYMGGF